MASSLVPQHQCVIQRGPEYFARKLTRASQFTVLTGPVSVVMPDFSHGQAESEVTLTLPEPRVLTADTVMRCL